MSAFMDTEGNYPLYVGDIVLNHPSWSPHQPLPEGYVEVHPTPRPHPASGKMVMPGKPEFDVDRWIQTWIQTDIETPFDELPTEIQNSIRQRSGSKRQSTGEETP